MKDQMTKIKSILNERLVKFGFKKRGYHYFVRMADEDIIQNIGFGIATYGEKHVRYLNPSIGVIYKDVNKLELHLRNLEKTKNIMVSRIHLAWRTVQESNLFTISCHQHRPTKSGCIQLYDIACKL